MRKFTLQNIRERMLPQVIYTVEVVSIIHFFLF